MEMMMRTNIEIDQKLVERAMKVLKTNTKRETVRLALESVVRAKDNADLLALRGKVVFFEGYDYKALRAGSTKP
jgi:Arc/MetJ family transcription regulator